jgi:hypothetical protein
MPAPATPHEMHRRMMVAFRKRLDVGLKQLAAGLLLEPLNPFEPEMKRHLSPQTILILLAVALGLASFIYFNYLP